MSGSGTSIFANFADFGAQLPGTVQFLALQPAPFEARITRVELPRLHLMRVQETIPRVSYTVLPSHQTYVIFRIDRGAPLTRGGVIVRPGDLAFHAIGERFHEHTVGPSRWGMICSPADALAAASQELTGRAISIPSTGLVFRPSAADRLQLMRLHAQAVRIAETHLRNLAHSQVVRSLDQDLMLALVKCLANPVSASTKRRRHLREPLMLRVEEFLSTYRDRVPDLGEIRAALDIPEANLSASCFGVLGIHLDHYLNLRRLKMARMEINI
jgi:hypothetical protein